MDKLTRSDLEEAVAAAIFGYDSEDRDIDEALSEEDCKDLSEKIVRKILPLFGVKDLPPIA